MSNIQKHFYQNNSPECSRQTNVFKPAAAYEIENNIQGIAENYRYPNDMNATEFEQTFDFGSEVFKCYMPPLKSEFEIIQIQQPSPDLMTALNNTWHELKALNPQLGTLDINPSNPLELLNAINGVACQLNTDDIGYFILMHRKLNRFDVFAKAIHHDTDLYAACEEMSKVTNDSNMGFHWLPAPSTIRKAAAAIAENVRHNIDNIPPPHP